MSPDYARRVVRATIVATVANRLAYASKYDELTALANMSDPELDIVAWREFHRMPTTQSTRKPARAKEAAA